MVPHRHDFHVLLEIHLFGGEKGDFQVALHPHAHPMLLVVLGLREKEHRVALVHHLVGGEIDDELRPLDGLHQALLIHAEGGQHAEPIPERVDDLVPEDAAHRQHVGMGTVVHGEDHHQSVHSRVLMVGGHHVGFPDRGQILFADNIMFAEHDVVHAKPHIMLE